jgi:hypothetical protein
MKRIISLSIAALFILASAGFSQSPTLTGHEIMVKVDERPDGDDSKSTLHMTLINKRGATRECTIISYSKEHGKDSKTIMYFEQPADVKGSGFLSWEYNDPGKDDDRWLYLPALKRVRRISGSSKNDYFMGSDFTYDDMGDRAVDEDEHTLLREEEIDGAACWIVESIPKDAGDMYSKTIRWIRRDNLLATRVEYFDKHHKLMKVLTLSNVRQVDGIWTALKMHMDNLQEKHQTILEFENIEYNTGLDDNLFTISTLQRGRF